MAKLQYMFKGQCLCLFEKYEDLEGGWIMFYWGHQEKLHEGGTISMDFKCVKFWASRKRVKGKDGKEWAQFWEHWEWLW